MSHILMFSHVPLIKEGALFTYGPGLRVWGLAQALLSQGHQVTIVDKSIKTKTKHENVTFLPDRVTIYKKDNLIKNYDAIYVQIWFNDRDMLDKLSVLPIVVDLYAPYLIEHLYYEYDLKNKETIQKFVDDIVFSHMIPLKYGDYFICASQRQKRFFLGMLSALGRVNPFTISRDLIGIVPFGITQHLQNTEQEDVLNLPKDKKVLLWISAFLPWIDPMKTAELIHRLSDEYVLAVIGAQNPFLDKSLYDKKYNAFIEYCRKHDLLHKKVFLYDWMSYEKLQFAMGQADFFVMTYDPNSLETDLAYRTRVIDALAAKLPLIISGNDILALQIQSMDMGIVIDQDIETTIEKIESLTESEIINFKENILAYIYDNTWEHVSKSFVDYCANPIYDEIKKEFNYDHIINSRRDLIVQLRKEVDDKEGSLKRLDETVKHQGIRLFETDEEKKGLLHAISQKDKDIEHLKNQISDLKNTIIGKDHAFSGLEHHAGKLQELSDQKERIISTLQENKVQTLDYMTSVNVSQENIIKEIYKSKNEALHEKERIINDILFFKEQLLEQKDHTINAVKSIAHHFKDMFSKESQHERKLHESQLSMLKKEFEKQHHEHEKKLQLIKTSFLDLLEQKEISRKEILTHKEQMLIHMKAQSQKEINQLQKQLDSLQEKARYQDADTSKIITEFKQEINQYKETLQDKDFSIIDLQKKQQQLETQISEQQHNSKNDSETITTLTAQLNDMRQKVLNLNNIIEESEKKQKILETFIHKVRTSKLYPLFRMFE